jgi:hypothetical protein
MRADFWATGGFGAIVIAALCLSAGGCSLLNDFGPRNASAVATSAPATTGSVDVKPAVLVQDGSQPPVTSAGPTRTANLDGVPPLPKDDATPTKPTSKLLSPEEKARVIAELEALASAPAGGQPTTSAKATCTTTTAAAGAAGGKGSPASAAAAACPPAKSVAHP